MDWLDEEVSLRGIHMVDNALEGGCGDVVPAWVSVSPALIGLGVLLFPVSIIAGGSIAMVVTGLVISL